MSDVKERPILFSGAMVNALLAGTKTQTRRKVKVQPKGRFDCLGGALWTHEDADDAVIKCPYGARGDRLWVRETFCLRYFDNTNVGILHGTTAYKADWTGSASDVVAEPKWKPSIHMPRWASRITLEVTDVRVQRLQDISEEDARAEGCPGESEESAAEEYAHLWNSINGPGSWAANPWVWSITFKRVPHDR